MIITHSWHRFAKGFPFWRSDCPFATGLPHWRRDSFCNRAPIPTRWLSFKLRQGSHTDAVPVALRQGSHSDAVTVVLRQGSHTSFFFFYWGGGDITFSPITDEYWVCAELRNITYQQGNNACNDCLRDRQTDRQTLYDGITYWRGDCRFATGLPYWRCDCRTCKGPTGCNMHHSGSCTQSSGTSVMEFAMSRNLLPLLKVILT